MSTASTSSGPITETTVVPVSKSKKGSNEAEPGFLKAYEAAYKMEDGKGDANTGERNSTSANATETKVQKEEQWPEIFQLIEEQTAEDFLELIFSDKEYHLFGIIRSERRERGVSQQVPISATHGKSDGFVNQMVAQYQSTGNRMRVNSGRSFSGLL